MLTLFTKYQINFTASNLKSMNGEKCVHFSRISCVHRKHFRPAVLTPQSSPRCLFIYICSTGNLFNRFLMQLEFSISPINWAHTMIEANGWRQEAAGGEYFQGMSGLIVCQIFKFSFVVFNWCYASFVNWFPDRFPITILEDLIAWGIKRKPSPWWWANISRSWSIIMVWQVVMRLRR